MDKFLACLTHYDVLRSDMRDDRNSRDPDRVRQYSQGQIVTTVTAKILSQPLLLGGGGFVPFYAVAGSGYVTHFLKHWRTPTEDAGKIICIVMAWSQYQSGVSYLILQQTSTPLPHIQGRCIPAIRQYLNDIGGTIQIDNTYVQQPLRHTISALWKWL